MLNKLLIDFSEAARLLSISRSKLYAMISTGQFGPEIIHIGRRSLLNHRELECWIDAGLPTRAQWKVREIS